MKIVGIIAAYNEELLIAACLEHHISQGLELYLIDNGSTDRTVEIAKPYLGRGLLGLDHMPRREFFEHDPLFARKLEVAAAVDADWILHLDADEMRLAPEGGLTLAQAIEEADAAGYNAINFLEFVFVPTVESPDHAHPRFWETMRWYYHYLPKALNQVKGWRKQPRPVDLAGSGGHWVRFPGQFIYPFPFRMRHYQFLSVDQAVRKYSQRRHPTNEKSRRKSWREQLDPAAIRLPSRSELHELDDSGRLDISRPKGRHFTALRCADSARPLGSFPGSRLDKPPRQPFLRLLREALPKRGTSTLQETAGRAAEGQNPPPGNTE